MGERIANGAVDGAGDGRARTGRDQFRDQDLQRLKLLAVGRRPRRRRVGELVGRTGRACEGTSCNGHVDRAGSRWRYGCDVSVIYDTK